MAIILQQRQRLQRHGRREICSSGKDRLVTTVPSALARKLDRFMPLGPAELDGLAQLEARPRRVTAGTELIQEREVAAVPQAAKTCWKQANHRIERLERTTASLTRGHWLAGPRPAHDDRGHVIGRPDLDWVDTMAGPDAATYTLQDLDAGIAEVEDILGVLSVLAGMLRS